MDFAQLKGQGIPIYQWPADAVEKYSQWLRVTQASKGIRTVSQKKARTIRRKAKLTRQQRIQLLKNYRMACWYCGEPLTVKTMDVDHVIPVSKGGSKAGGNVIPACSVCNKGKDDLLISEYRSLFPVQPHAFWGEIKGLPLKKKIYQFGLDRYSC